MHAELTLVGEVYRVGLSTPSLRKLVESIQLGPNVRPFFGEQVGPVVVTELFSKLPESGPVGIKWEGWLAEWHFRKADREGKPDGFAYGLNVFLPTGISHERVLELVFGRFRVFVDHELQEGLILRPFDPHPTGSPSRYMMEGLKLRPLGAPDEKGSAKVIGDFKAEARELARCQACGADRLCRECDERASKIATAFAQRAPEGGAAKIAAERRRQIEVKGWTAEHDDGHKNCELALAAISFAAPDGVDVRRFERVSDRCTTMRDPWPFDVGAVDKRAHSYVERLVIAGAFLAAEIDRLERLEKRSCRD